MAFARNGDVRLHWRQDGDGPALLLLNSIGFDLTLWDGATSHLGDFSLIRMDTRGHGGSDAPPGDYSLDDLTADVCCVLDAAGAERVAVCGLSLGGMMAMSLALAAPARVSSLVLACTSARMDSQAWDTRLQTVRAQGMPAIADMAVARFFSEAFRQARPQTVARVRAQLAASNGQGYAGCCAAIRDMALLDRIAALASPTLVIAGDQDISTPLAGHGDEIRARIRSAQLATLPTGHIAPLEMPAAFAAHVKNFVMGARHD